MHAITKAFAQDVRDFDRGEEAFYNSNDAAYFTGSSALKDGYKNAWHKEFGAKYENDGNGADSAFENWIAQIESETVTPKDLSFEPHARLRASVTALIITAMAVASFLTYVATISARGN